MKAKDLLYLLTLALPLANPVEAQTATPAGTWTVTPAVVSQYMFRGVRIGGPSLQPAVEYGQGDLAAGLWANFPLKDKVPGVSDPEFDFYGSYTHSLNATTSVVTGATCYAYPNADKAAGFYQSTVERSRGAGEGWRADVW